MAPARIHSIAAKLQRRLNDQFDVGIVVCIRSSCNLDVLIGEVDKLSVGLEVLWCCHDSELNRLFVAEMIIEPSSNASNAFHSS